MPSWSSLAAGGSVCQNFRLAKSSRARLLIPFLRIKRPNSLPHLSATCAASVGLISRCEKRSAIQAPIRGFLSRLVAQLVEDPRGRQRCTKHGEANAPRDEAPDSLVILVLHKTVIVCECDRGDRASDHADQYGAVTRCFLNPGVSQNKRRVPSVVVSALRWPGAGDRELPLRRSETRENCN